MHYPLEDLMPLGWETNTKYTVESESLGGSELGMGNPRARAAPYV